jgi:hypothetical protein
MTRKHSIAFVVAVLALAGAFCLRPAHAGENRLPSSTAGTPMPSDPAPSPILVELFTSEGCSSCPPADVLLQRMDEAQPVSGARLIVLSEHVDYWDHLGWKDPYSSHQFTERQSAYVNALREPTAYTPQMIVDGTSELSNSDPRQAEQVFQKALNSPKVLVQIDSLSIQGTSPGILHAHISTDGDDKHSAEIYVAVALDHAESQVLRGENGGHRLTHVAVVQSLTKIGKLTRDKKFDQDVPVPVRPGTDPSNLRVIAFVQEHGPGQILGAAMRKLGK